MHLRPVCGPLPSPARRNALLDPRRNHLGDVASAQCDALAGELYGARFSLYGSRQALKLLSANDKRRKIEAKGELDLAGRALAGVALAVRTVPPDDKTRVDEDGEVATQRRCRHAVGAQRELEVRGENDKIVLARQRSLRMECEKRVQNREGALRHAE